MEEDIKILEETINHWNNGVNTLENLLKRHKELEEEISSREKSHMDLYNDFKHYKQYESIPISVIQNKINWHKNYEGTVLYKKYNYELIIQVLHELMEE